MVNTKRIKNQNASSLKSVRAGKRGIPEVSCTKCVWLRSPAALAFAMTQGMYAGRKNDRTMTNLFLLQRNERKRESQPTTKRIEFTATHNLFLIPSGCFFPSHRLKIKLQNFKLTLQIKNV